MDNWLVVNDGTLNIVIPIEDFNEYKTKGYELIDRFETYDEAFDYADYLNQSI